MSARGQSLPKCDVRVTSVHSSISDMTLQRGERRNGPGADKWTFAVDQPYGPDVVKHTVRLMLPFADRHRRLTGPPAERRPCSVSAPLGHELPSLRSRRIKLTLHGEAYVKRRERRTGYDGRDG